MDPTLDPTMDPSVDPTMDPTVDPSMDPTLDPTMDPSVEPTQNPTKNPTPIVCTPAVDGFATSCETNCNGDAYYNGNSVWTEGVTVQDCASLCTDGCTGFVWRIANGGKCKFYGGAIAVSDMLGESRQCVVKIDDPTMDPTVDPSMDPTLDPTMDPSVDPTMDPTFDPSMDP